MGTSLIFQRLDDHSVVLQPYFNDMNREEVIKLKTGDIICWDTSLIWPNERDREMYLVTSIEHTLKQQKHACVFAYFSAWSFETNSIDDAPYEINDSNLHCWKMIVVA